MSARNELLWFKMAFVLLVSLLLVGEARAYTLPAPEFIGQFMALATWVFVAFASVLMYPVYALLRFFRCRLVCTSEGKKGETPTPAALSDERP
jgi:hypothetical protein